MSSDVQKCPVHVYYLTHVSYSLALRTFIMVIIAEFVMYTYGYVLDTVYVQIYMYIYAEQINTELVKMEGICP